MEAGRLHRLQWQSMRGRGGPRLCPRTKRSETAILLMTFIPRGAPPTGPGSCSSDASVRSDQETNAGSIGASLVSAGAWGISDAGGPTGGQW